MKLLSEVRLSVSSAGVDGLSTRERVFGSHAAELEPALLDDRTSAFECGRGGPDHTCEAALDAAGGGRVRIVVAIFPEPGRSF